MKSSLQRRETTASDSEHEDTEPTPTDAPSRPSVADTAATYPRPQLIRSPPARLSNIARSPEGNNEEHQPTGGTAVADDGLEALAARNDGGGAESEAGQGMSSQTSPDEGTLAKLKDAVNAKLLLQQRMRTSYGNKRPSPAREDSNASPRPLSTVSSGSSGMTTASTESTESAKTIKGSVPATPAATNLPIRTPSYPFPYVPGTPRAWSSSFHQPFTTLSPTTTGEHGTPSGTSDLTSGNSTPAATGAMFMPPNAHTTQPTDPRFPTPNLYDLVLQLNSEPGLEAWWATVTNIMHTHFKADRVTLAMPADPTDIENVPWGQKATFSMNGPEDFVMQPETPAPSHFVRPDFTFREPSSEAMSDVRPQKLHPERLRPRLDSRHSYAGHARESRDSMLDTPPSASARPAGPQRTVTYAGEMPNTIGTGRPSSSKQPTSASTRNTSLTDMEFSSNAGGVDAGPHAEVYTVLRALDHEAHPLIESGGVNRVLERGRVVTVTRDYVPEADAKQTASAAATPAETPADVAKDYSKLGKFFGNYRHALASENAAQGRPAYEEYEQQPTSPWAQSPAPSPAIQADEEQNPFFASQEQQVEDSFNPTTTTPKDYAQFGQVEAIGVDLASTVLHIPLVHPTLSQSMQSLRFAQSREKSAPSRSNTLDAERKAPIAILSVLGSPVPYPPNLTQTMKLLGPHLATSLSIAQQFSAGSTQTMSLRHRRTASGRPIHGSMTIEPTTLDEIVNADLEDPTGSATGSITSPSDYSGRSRHSPGSSLAGTPGWDPAAHGWTASRSVAGTPAISGTEIVDNYFDAKKRSIRRAGSNASTSMQATPARSARKQSGHETRPQSETDSSRSDRKLRISSSAKDDKSPLRYPDSERGPAVKNDALVSSPQKPTLGHAYSGLPESSDKRHSFLHSYGADYQSSFGAVSAVTAPDSRIAGTGAHARKASYSEEMPPPSERLLRTIIDSLPVQIFTAAPDTGKLTWVNSKFLIYRGQDSRQVLSEPWQAIHPEDRQEYSDAWSRSLRTGQQLQQKVRLQRFDGNYRWFYVRAAPLKDKRQKIVHWIGTNMDFHEQHMAELNLARQQETAASEAKYRALANSSPQIVFAVNRTRGVTFCNSQWLFFSGQSEPQALGVGFMDHVHPDDLAKCRLPSFDNGSSQPTNVPTSMPPEPRRSKSMSMESSSGSSDTEKGSTVHEASPTQHNQRRLSELASTGILKVSRDSDGRPSYSTEVRLRNRDGEYRWHLVRVLLAEPLLQAGSDEETWYGTCTDINDHKTLERDLKETMDEKSRFLSNMSHEIRTPLNGITGMVNFLIDSNLTTEQMEHVNIIRASTEGLRGLINDILDLSKAEAGMIQLNMDWMYPRSLIEEVNDLTSTMAIDKGLELNYVVDPEVPAQVKADRFRLRQILLNVVGNAIKFTQEGEVFISCSIHVDEDTRLPQSEMFIAFEVADTGRGFTDKEAEALFKRFSQIDGSSTRQHGGTGLGLVISRQLAQLHGGDMSAKGSPGKGSTFRFYIKTSLPSGSDQPPAPLPTPGVPTIPILPMNPSLVATPAATPGPTPRLSKTSSAPEPHDRPSPRSTMELTTSPSPYASPDITQDRESPSVSSIGSESMKSAARTGSVRSEHSSASSYYPDPALPSTTPMQLKMPRSGSSASVSTGSGDSTATIRTPNLLDPAAAKSPGALAPPMFSVLVVAPLKHSREATVQHIDQTLPRNVPHQITARESLLDCQKMLGGSDTVTFSHVVAVLQDVREIIALMDQILSTPVHSATTIVIITDLAQRRKIMEEAPQFKYKSLESEGRLIFIFKPLKPSRFAVVFDPQKGREMSTDRNQDSAQQVAATQKQVFEELTKRLGNKGKRVLLVEDNKVNQMVILKFFSKIAINIDTVMDGVQCTEKVFAHPPGYYSIILVSRIITEIVSRGCLS